MTVLTCRERVVSVEVVSALFCDACVPVVQWPRTPPFHGGNTGSNPVGDANKIKHLAQTPQSYRRPITSNKPDRYSDAPFPGSNTSRATLLCAERFVSVMA